VAFERGRGEGEKSKRAGMMEGKEEGWKERSEGEKNGWGRDGGREGP